jgi:tetratricopeptide (TPR) repeat protein
LQDNLSSPATENRAPCDAAKATTLIGRNSDRACASSEAGLQSKRPMQHLTGTSTTNSGTTDLQALCTRAFSLIHQQRYREAAAALDQARTLAPQNAEIWNALSLCAREVGQFQAALALSRRATSLNPRSPGTWSNFGALYRVLRMPEMAVACFEHAAALDPHTHAHYYNLGAGHAAAGRHAAAIEFFTQALAIAPGNPQALYARALCHLARGDFRLGWLDYEARFAAGIVPQRTLPGRPWAMQRYAGQRLLIGFEQGMGDGMWAARMLPAAKALGGELVVECPEPLIRLFKSMGVVDRFVRYGEALPDADWYSHLCSLPGLVTSSLQDIRATPYLVAARSSGDKFRVLREVSSDLLKVGIVWSGNTRFKRNMHRATSLKRFVDAFTLPGIQLFSLQKDEPAAEIGAYEGIVDLAPLLDDFADTAAAVAELDLVIMTDSAVAHLAGAMGRPVWVLLGHDPAWFWLTERTDSPWYGSLRLFRASGPDDWTGVFDAAAAALLRLTRQGRSSG